MASKSENCVMDIESSAAEVLPRNPYCLNEGAQCGCRLHNVIIQPQMATGKLWSLWKTCLVCLLACLTASAIVVLVLYFGWFNKPNSNTTIIIHADGKSSQNAVIPSPTPSLDSLTSSGPQSTTPSAPTTSQSSTTGVLTTSVETTTSPTTTTTSPTTTIIHEVIIEDD